VVAVTPRYIAGERGKHVEEAPGYDHIIVDTGEQRYAEHTPANACMYTVQTTLSAVV